MNGLSAPVPDETLAEAGERIRAACPIRGATATNDECRNRRELIDDTITTRGIASAAYIWHTAQLADGHVVGVFAGSAAEAEIDITVWCGGRCHWVVADPDCRILHAYHPGSKRTASDVRRSFPLGRPRRSADQFAPQSSLLDLLGPATGWNDAHSTAPGI